MALPVQSVRALPEHRDVLKTVAALLRDGHADRLRRLLRAGAADEVPAAERPFGPFRSKDAALEVVRDRLVAVLAPRMVWLLAEPDEAAGLELLAVVPDLPPPVAAAPLAGCGLSCRLEVRAWSAFVREGEARAGFADRAVREGRLLYQDPMLRDLLRPEGSPPP